MTYQKGFNLIELMIVILIIAVLAAIATSAYGDQVAKAQAKAAFAEISQGRVQFEILANNNDPINTAGDIGLPSVRGRCRDIQVEYDPDTGAGLISCRATGAPAVEGKRIILTRSGSGRWSCSSEISSTYRPVECSQAEEAS